MLTDDLGLTASARYLSPTLTLWNHLPASVRRQLEAALVARVQSDATPEESRVAAAFILRHLVDARRPEMKLSAETHIVALGLPDLPQARPPAAQWLADGAITAALSFYSDERSFQQSKSWFEEQGFRRNAALENARGYDGRNTLVLERSTRANGQRVAQRIILTVDNDLSAKRILNADDIDIVVHRGHSYHFTSTFPPDLEMTSQHPKLLFGGSCGSYSDMTHHTFAARYGHHALMADEDSGLRRANDRTTLALLEGAAAGAQEWDAYPLQGLREEHNLRLPSEPSLQVGAYRQTLASRWRRR